MAKDVKDKENDSRDPQYTPDVGNYSITSDDTDQFINDLAFIRKQLILSLLDTYGLIDYPEDDIIDESILIQYDNQAYEYWVGYDHDVLNTNVPISWNIGKFYAKKYIDDTNPLSSFINPEQLTTENLFNSALPSLHNPVSLDTKFGDWAVGKSIDYLINHAKSKSIHLCATYVKNAIAAGGKPYITGHAQNMHTDGILDKMGFKQIAEIPNSNNVSWTKEYANPGDIAVYKRPDGAHQYGHICMYTGEKWISDFVQNSMWVYGGMKGNIWIYRHPS